ncbi:MAG: U32 family peptidase [Clostridia bacterium]|nr:U32 family peptidase [Clostridia bacterium]
MNKIPELLCPAGDEEQLKASVEYGADAVYLAGKGYGMRAGAGNFDAEQMKQAVAYAHAHGVKVYVTCNTVPTNDEINHIEDYLKACADAGVDAFIISDMGVLTVAKAAAPQVPIHISVQAGIVNWRAAKTFYELGAKRVVLARELSFEEIAEIRAKVPADLEIECFVHGAVCVSFSARCLLSAYMTGRDANRGDCAQSCRWSYSLMEEKRPGQYFDITESDKGTHILNADDMCMAQYIDKLCAAGIDSIKIEGRAKSGYYAAVCANANRCALDSYKNADGDWHLPDWIAEELEKISHRRYSTGFYFGRPSAAQNFATASYVRSYSVAAVVSGYEDGMVLATLKNKFAAGTELDALIAGEKPYLFKADPLYDQKGNALMDACHPMMTIKIPCERELPVGTMLRMKMQDIE